MILARTSVKTPAYWVTLLANFLLIKNAQLDREARASNWDMSSDLGVYADGLALIEALGKALGEAIRLVRQWESCSG